MQQFVQALYDRGYIYAGEYEALYCVGCEEFKPESEIVDGTGAASGADQAGLAVAKEEGRIGRWIVVVEQLEQEAETALRAAASALAKAGAALRRDAAVATVRTPVLVAEQRAH